ncbi:MerR family transcriptional regulator, partial [Vibrio sp. Vb2362]|nr:MerR family transcriptional regulator [Vibrio sp. Vb2362]
QENLKRHIEQQKKHLSALEEKIALYKSGKVR